MQLRLAQRIRRSELGLSLFATFRFFSLLLERIVAWVTRIFFPSTAPPSPELGFWQQWALECTRYVMRELDEGAQQRLYLKEAEMAVKKLQTPPVAVTSDAHAQLLSSSLWLGGQPSADIATNAKECVLIFIHGGGFVVGHAAMWAEFCQQLVERSKKEHGVTLRVLSVAHPLSVSFAVPDGKHLLRSSRTATNDSADHGFQRNLATVRGAWAHLTTELLVPPQRIAIAGDSSGANLAIASCIDMRDRARLRIQGAHNGATNIEAIATQLPAACLLFSPHTDLSSSALWHRGGGGSGRKTLSSRSSERTETAEIAGGGGGGGAQHSKTPADGSSGNEHEFGVAAEEEEYIDYVDERVESIWAARYLENSRRYFREHLNTTITTNTTNTTSGNSNGVQQPMPDKRDATGEEPHMKDSQAERQLEAQQSQQLEEQLARFPLISPFYADLSPPLPPSLINYGGRELLAPDIRRFVAKLRREQGATTASHVVELCYPQGVHDYTLLGHIFEEASSQATQAAVAFMCARMQHKYYRTIQV